MITFFEANLQLLAVHHVGNPLHDQLYNLSETTFEPSDDVMNSLLMQYFLLPFEKTNQVFNFMHPSGNVELNDTYRICREIFSGKTSLIEGSQQLTKYLYSVSSHPKIKAGELYVAYFDNIQIEGELHNTIGIFKSESKEAYLKVDSAINSFDLSYEQQGTNINKLDKGCLIFNNKDGKYKVAVIDNTGKATSSYWMDDFLQLKLREDSFTQTSTLLGICKSFVMDKLPENFELTETDKADLLNRTIKYFKEKETFDKQEFTGEVLNNKEAADLFTEHKNIYELDFDVTLPDNFEISESAVKKQAKAFNSVIKLDRNFKLHVTGNKELIEKGFDQEKQLNYYKVYFKEEKL